MPRPCAAASPVAEECPICFEEHSPDRMRSMLPCKHRFCAACTRRAVQFQSRCAVCRGGLTGMTPRAHIPSNVTGRRNVPLTRRGKQPFGVVMGCDAADAACPIFVAIVRRGTAAARAGLHVDDRVWSLNGLPCTSHVVAGEILGRCQRVQLVVSRPVTRRKAAALPTEAHSRHRLRRWQVRWRRVRDLLAGRS